MQKGHGLKYLVSLRREYQDCLVGGVGAAKRKRMLSGGARGFIFSVILTRISAKPGDWQPSDAVARFCQRLGDCSWFGTYWGRGKILRWNVVSYLS